MIPPIPNAKPSRRRRERLLRSAAKATGVIGSRRVVASTAELNGIGIAGLRTQLVRSGWLPVSPFAGHDVALTQLASRDRDPDSNGSADGLASASVLSPLVRYAIAIWEEALPASGPPPATSCSPLASALSAHCDRMLAIARAFFEDFRPCLGLINQGYRPESAVIRQVCIENDIPVLALENTALRDRFIWDCVSGITTNVNLSANYHARHAGHLDQRMVDERIEAMIQDTKSLKSTEHASPEQVESTVGGEIARKPYVLFLGQVYTDSAVVFGRADWDSPERLIAATVAAAKRGGLRVIVKLHPKEAGGCDPVFGKPYRHLTWRKLSQHSISAGLLDDPNVFVDRNNELDTYPLIDRAQAVVTLTSQSGLEAAIRGRRVIVAGRCFYAGQGFTHDAPHPEAFDSVFDRCLRTAENRTHRDAARRFAFVHFFRYCRAKSATAVRDLVRMSSHLHF